MNKIVVYSSRITPRLEYAVSFIFKTVLGCPFLITDQLSAIAADDYVINYSTNQIDQQDIQFFSQGCLFEEDIHIQNVNTGNWEELPVIFYNSLAEIPFDIFSATFYLISRYEEYLDYTPDLYKRFPAQQSIAYQMGFLQRPLVDEWVKKFKQKITSKNKTILFEKREMKFIPTYDIDMAYSFKGKGVTRNFGGFVKDFLSGNLISVKERIQVLLFTKKDPFDSFDEMDLLHKKYNLHPIYFILVGENGEFDKNIQASHPLMIRLIKRIQRNYQIGVHPSYGSHECELKLKKEISCLSSQKSRQHYIRFSLPETYRLLLSNGIQEDYSMGYGTVNGFRASTSYPFYWFDLSKNDHTSLMIYPFCFMDCNSRFEQEQGVADTITELQYYCKLIKNTGGYFIGIWHNFALGSDPQWKGWMGMFEEFLAWNKNVQEDIN